MRKVIKGCVLVAPEGARTFRFTNFTKFTNLTSFTRLTKLTILLALSLLLSLAAGSDREQLRYNQVQQKASHNSYQRKESIITQLKDFRIRTIEFDIHKKAGASERDWWVYHNLKGDATVCGTLSECFAKVIEFHRAEPEHEVVTIFFDVEPLGVKADKDDLNRMFIKSFPAGAILKPWDLMAACPSATNLQESVTRPGCGWPRLKDIRGKFILVITGGFKVFQDLNYDLKNDSFFLASYARAPEAISLVPDQIFFNLAGPDAFAKTAQEAGFVSRCYWLNSRKDYESAMKLGANLLATDNLDPKQFPWTVTAADDGWPFSVIKR